MSELDLSAPTAPPVVTPPAADPASSLVLAPPAPVVVIEKEQAAGAIPLDAATQTALKEKAAAFATELATLDPKSPAFTEKISSITSMGDADIRASANVSNRLLERPAALAKGGKSGDAQTRVAGTLVELRSTVT